MKTIIKRIACTILLWAIPIVGVYLIFSFPKGGVVLEVVGAVGACLITFPMLIPTARIWGFEWWNEEGGKQC